MDCGELKETKNCHSVRDFRTFNDMGMVLRLHSFDGK